MAELGEGADKYAVWVGAEPAVVEQNVVGMLKLVAGSGAAPHPSPESVDKPELFPAGLVNGWGLDRRGPPLDPPPLWDPPGM